MYPKNIRRIAGFILVLECLILITGLGYLAYVRLQPRILGASVSRINKKNIVTRPSEKLAYFYEWDANQTISHERSWLPKAVIAKTNSDGIIGGIEYQKVKPAGVFRIIAIGDSFTEGPYVEPDHNYPWKLERMLNSSVSCGGHQKFEVLNFGVGGYDIQYASHRFLMHTLEYNPDMILWFMKEDDFQEIVEIGRKKEEEYASFIRDQLENDIGKFDKYIEWNNRIIGAANLQERVQSIVVIEQLRDADQQQYFFIQDAAVNDVINQTNAPLLLFTFKGTPPMFKARMKLWSMNPGVYYFDGVPDLKPTLETFDPHDGHPNEAGYRKIASSLYEFLSQADLICP